MSSPGGKRRRKAAAPAASSSPTAYRGRGSSSAPPAGRKRWVARVAVVALLVIAPVTALVVLPRLRPAAPLDEAGRRAMTEAQADFDAGRFPQAITVAEQELAREPKAPGFHYLLGAALESTGEHARAVEHFRSEIERSPKHFDSRLRLATSLIELQQLDDANQALRAALDLQPGQPRASFLLGKNLARAGDVAGAEPLLQVGAKAGVADAWYELGLLAKKRGDAAGAEDAFRRALAQNPEHLEAMFELGQILTRAGKEQEGQRYLGRHAELEKSHDRRELLEHRAVEPGAGADKLEDLARWFLLEHDLDSAIATFEKAIAKDPERTSARVGLGQTQLEQGRAADAATTLAQAVERAPDDADAQFFLGLSRHLVGDYRGAQAALQRSRELRPWTAKEHLFLGNVLLAGGALADAEQAYRASLAAGPEIPEARYKLALVLEQRDRAADALPELERFIELEPRDPRGALLLGLAQHRTGDVAAAEATFRRALDRLDVAVPEPAAREAMLAELHALPGAPEAIERLDALRRERTAAGAQPQPQPLQ